MRRLAAILALVLLVPAPLRAGNHGSVRITVVDADGKPLAGVRVRVTNKDTWVTHEEETGDDGSVFYYKVAAGEFRLRIEKKGYELRSDARPCLSIVADRKLVHRATLRASGARGRAHDDPCPRLEPTSQESTILDPAPWDPSDGR